MTKDATLGGRGILAPPAAMGEKKILTAYTTLAHTGLRFYTFALSGADDDAYKPVWPSSGLWATSEGAESSGDDYDKRVWPF